MRFIFFYLVLVGAAFRPVTAQDAEECSLPDRKAEKYFNQAMESYRSKDYKSFENSINKALEIQNEYGDAWLLKIRYWKERGNRQQMLSACEKLVEACPGFSPEPHYFLGEHYFSTAEYELATVRFRAFLGFSGVTPEQAGKAEALLRIAAFRVNAMSNPVPFSPQSVPGVCTSEDEYLPIISPDNELAFFTRRFRKESKNRLTEQLVEEFTFSKSESGVFGKGLKMPPPFNTSNNEGGATVTIDNKSLYFTICRPELKGINCDIYASSWKNNGWSPITNLGKDINDPLQWDSQPSISSDGNTLYFASNRDGGYGGIDIYKCERDSLGGWGRPVNLGPGINTAGNEKSPFIHTDSRTLYFSSDSLTGMGGYDIFLSKQNANGSWEVPRNIGYPINSESDDIGFFVSTDGKTGYFASNKLQGKGGWDVYSFFLYPEARPDKVLFVKGQLKDEASGKPAQGRVEFKNLSNQRVHRVEVDSATGSYVSALRFDTDYTMTIKKEGYAPVSRFISKDDPHYALPVKEDVSLKQLEVGGVYVMDNIHFQTNSYVLSDTAKALLDDFTVFLTENPGVRISVNGHTDDVNDAESNRILSENRAREVFLYLTLRGISKSRLAYAGFGESRPVSSNATPEGRAKNRRTEFVILSR